MNQPHIHIYPLPFGFSFLFKSPQCIKQSSLCYIVGCHYIICFIHSINCICASIPTSSLLPPTSLLSYFGLLLFHYGINETISEWSLSLPSETTFYPIVGNSLKNAYAMRSLPQSLPSPTGQNPNPLPSKSLVPLPTIVSHSSVSTPPCSYREMLVKYCRLVTDR